MTVQNKVKLIMKEKGKPFSMNFGILKPLNEAYALNFKIGGGVPAVACLCTPKSLLVQDLKKCIAAAVYFASSIVFEENSAVTLIVGLAVFI